jgi:uncharacterized membrane protein
MRNAQEVRNEKAEEMRAHVMRNTPLNFSALCFPLSVLFSREAQYAVRDTQESGHTRQHQAAPAGSAPRGVPDNSRIHAFSDGVFSITITLLVFGLQVPEVDDPSQLPGRVLEMWPRLLGHLVTFAVIGIYWVGHHNMFFHIKRHDRVLLWLNLLFLGLVASMPFWTDMLLRYPDQQITVVAYAGMLALIGFALDSIWRYASSGRRLVDPNMDEQLVAFVHRRVLLAPIIYLASIPITFISPLLAELVFMVVVALYIIPNPLDHYHSRALSMPADDMELRE